MKRFWWAVAIGAMVPMALAAAASARTQSPSGDTCTASGSGTAYTLHITIPSGAVQQFGFAFGAAGSTVTNVVIPGANGNFSTQGLAPKTSGAWVSDSPLTGSPVASVTTSAAATGSLKIVPASASQSTYFNPVTCALSTSTPSTSVAFSVDPHVTYTAAARLWHLVVTVPTAGAVSARQPEPTSGAGSSKPVTAKSLVQSRQVSLKSAGKITLALRPTATGQVALKAKGSIKVKLRVTFDAKNGKSASKLVSLTLSK